MTRVFKLYCGRQIPTTKLEVTEKDFQNFLNNQSLFDGFTIWQAEGYWKGELEKTFIIEIATNETEKILELAKLYQSKFKQQAVLIIESTDKVRWVE